MAVIPFGEWQPDLPAHQLPGLVTCKGIIPRTSQSYGPFKAFGVHSSALTARCQGAFAGRDTSGNVNLFAGDVADLYRLTSASTTWENVSRGAGVPDYATASDGRWVLAQYGKRVIATNFADDMQSYVIGTSTDFAQLAAAAPRARALAVVRDHVMVGNTFDGTDGAVPERVWWCAIDDPTSWPTIGSAAAAAAQSDRQDLVGEGGAVQTLVGSVGVGDGVVIQERAVQRITYVGPPQIYQFDLVQGARGTVAPGSVAHLGAVIAYLGENGFYMFDGRTSVPIGHDKIDRTFFADLDQTYATRIASAIDPVDKLFFWAYPGADNTNGVPNRLLTWNWALGRWSLQELTTEMILRAATFGYNLDNADGLGYNVDTSPFSPDDRFWAGGLGILAAFDSSHRLGYFNGANLAATIETGDMDLAEGRRVYMDGIRPVVDGGTVTVSAGYRDLQSAAVSYTTARAAGDDGFSPHNISARFIRAKVEVAASGSWSHAHGVEPRAIADGQR